MDAGGEEVVGAEVRVGPCQEQHRARHREHGTQDQPGAEDRERRQDPVLHEARRCVGTEEEGREEQGGQAGEALERGDGAAGTRVHGRLRRSRRIRTMPKTLIVNQAISMIMEDRLKS